MTALLLAWGCEKENPTDPATPDDEAAGCGEVRGPVQPEGTDYEDPLVVVQAGDSGDGTLRRAIANAAEGDVIIFDANLAGETIALDSELYIDKGLTLDGGDARGLVLSGNNSNRIFRVEAEKEVTLRHLTISNGKANNSGAIDPDLSRGRGGAIITENKAHLTLSHCTMADNTANQGGAVFSGYKASLVVRNCRFEANTGTGNTLQDGNEGVLTGGAITAQGESEGKLEIYNSRFMNNEGVIGGAVGVIHTAVTIDNCEFTGNQSAATNANEQTSGHGGAIYTDGASGKTNGEAHGGVIEIYHSLIKNNQSQHEGGGALLFTYDPDEVVVEQTTFEGNTVTERPGYGAFGGGLRNGGGAITIRQCAFINNVSEGKGGGMYLDNYSPATIVHTTISGNEARKPDNSGGQGAGLMVATDDPVSLEHITLANNVARFQGGGFSGKGTNTTLAHSIIYNNVAENNGNGWDIKHHTTAQLNDGDGNFQWPAKNPDDQSDINITAEATIADPQLRELTSEEQECYLPYHPVPGDSPAAGKGAQP